MLPKFDWFQTDEAVTVTILKRGTSLDECQMKISEKTLVVTFKEENIFEGRLFGCVKPESATLSCTPSKVEVKVPKASFGRWASLIEKEEQVASSTRTPSASTTKNWDALEKAAIDEEENEQIEGDAAVNRMFQKLYADASEDTRRAMIKSFQESNGTVLSTNWDEIKKKKVETKPPDSMEFKEYPKY